jgi:hypothetical protein
MLLRTHWTKENNLQEEVNDMISDYRYYIGIRPQSDRPPLFKVFRKDYSRENHQKNIIAYDGDRSIDRNHRPEVEGRRAILGNRSGYLLHYANKTKSTCGQWNPTQNLPENALRRLYK